MMIPRYIAGADNNDNNNDDLSGGEETLPMNMIRWLTTKHRRTNRCGNFLIKWFFDFLEDAEERKDGGSDDELNKWKRIE